jgi:hypothetical protein
MFTNGAGPGRLVFDLPPRWHGFGRQRISAPAPAGTREGFAYPTFNCLFGWTKIHEPVTADIERSFSEHAARVFRAHHAVARTGPG